MYNVPYLLIHKFPTDPSGMEGPRIEVFETQLQRRNIPNVINNEYLIT